MERLNEMGCSFIFAMNYFSPLVGVVRIELTRCPVPKTGGQPLAHTPIEEVLLLRNKLNFDPRIFRNIKEIKVISRKITHNA